MATNRDLEQRLGMIQALQNYGISTDDAHSLRRISMTLHRWHELECGDSNDYASWTISRGRKVNGTFEYDDNGDAYEERHVHSENKARYTKIADKERGALKRLKAIMAKYPALTAYIQGDPRGASLYVLQTSDIPAGADIASCYNRGIAIYK